VGYTAVVEQLVDPGKVKPDYQDTYGWTALSWAIGKGCTAVLQSLATGRVDANIRGHYERSPRWWAVLNGHETVITLLLNKNLLEVNAEHINGSTLLLWVVQSGCQSIVTLLLATGKVDISIENRDGWTLMSWQNNTTRTLW
jgi:ankyrin repeat protein